jgi:4'-phosphopantetheinyl transferase EntD
MRENVKLKNITSDNLKATEDLELCAGQEYLVASNLLYSVAETKFDLSLQRAIDTLTVPGLLIGHRVISQGDELALLHEEVMSLSFPAIQRRRASGAARRMARELMKSMGFVGLPILRSTFGAPIWPAGVVGSMAHDDQIAVATVGLRSDLDAVGIDIEPAAPLQSDMLDLIATPSELHAIADNPLVAKILFVIKEAVYKATYPLDHEFLDFHDIEVDLANRIATTRTGRTLALHWCVFSHVLVVATIQKASILWTTCPRVEKVLVRSTTAL